jgi:hypothetical protein
MNKSKDITNVTKSKKKYKVRNWGEYNKSLINRGSLTVWISEDIQEWWYGTGHDTYSDKSIEVMLTFHALYRLPLRSTSGFVQSIFTLMGKALSVPDYTTISRRSKKVQVHLQKTQKTITDMILDSTGAKVFGEGEWKVRKHGWSKRRTWKKIHIGIDSLGEIRAIEVTNKDIHDSVVINDILSQEQADITDFYGDGAYDTFSVYQALLNREVLGVHIPLQVNAKIQVHGNFKRLPYPRDVNLREIRKSTRKVWKQNSGYHTRSLGETIMYRYKKTFGDHLSFRTDERQKNEVITKCNILNVFHALGVPDSYLVT